MGLPDQATRNRRGLKTTLTAKADVGHEKCLSVRASFAAKGRPEEKTRLPLCDARRITLLDAGQADLFANATIAYRDRGSQISNDARKGASRSALHTLYRRTFVIHHDTMRD